MFQITLSLYSSFYILHLRLQSLHCTFYCLIKDKLIFWKNVSGEKMVLVIGTIYRQGRKECAIKYLAQAIEYQARL